MQAPSQDIHTEAKQLGVTIEQEGNEFVAILPAHPDLPDDTELGFPAPTEQEALDEIRAYRSIEQSAVYKFEYDEKRDLYVVRFGDQSKENKLLAQAYREAQSAYAAMINDAPPSAEAPTTEPPKQRKPRRTQSNGPIPAATITSGTQQGQLSQQHLAQDPVYAPTALPAPPPPPTHPPASLGGPQFFTYADAASLLEEFARLLRTKGNQQ